MKDKDWPSAEVVMGFDSSGGRAATVEVRLPRYIWWPIVHRLHPGKAMALGEALHEAAVKAYSNADVPMPRTVCGVRNAGAMKLALYMRHEMREVYVEMQPKELRALAREINEKVDAWLKDQAGEER